MLGLNGIVIKSHGSADVVSYANAIKIAILEVEKSVPEHIRECMAPLLKQAAKTDNKKAENEQTPEKII
jgi:glycerol-3-phosphate acyltransferase PlsX